MPISRRILGRQAATSLYGRSKGQSVSYDTVGMTLVPGDAAVPDGYREHTASKVVGSGEDVFRRVGYTVMHYGLQREAGFDVKSQHASVTEGARVAMAVPTVWPLAVVAAAEVVAVVATGRSTGFALGTLASHPVRGEELITVTHHDDDRVEVTIRSITQPARWWARLGAGAQRRAVRKQLAAAERAAAAPSTDLALLG